MEVLRFIRDLGTELSETGVAYYNQELRSFSYGNAHFLYLFDISEQQLKENYRPLLQLLKPQDVERLRSQYAEHGTIGHFRNIELELNYSDGRKRFVSCDTIHVEEGRGILLFVKDISRRKYREDYVISQSAQKDTLLDMLTHNLSGPLHVSRDILNVLRKGVDENNVQHLSRMISLVEENTEQCINIVNDFLKQEHAESMRISVSATWFNMMEKINIILEKLRELNKQKVFSLSCEVAKPVILADDVKFFQVIHNLLSNSVKFTPADGQIDITITETSTTFILSVQDNGVGVDEKVRPHLFSERINGREGLAGEKSQGLGLGVARKLVDLMKGYIWFDYLYTGQGSIFHVELPKEFRY